MNRSTATAEALAVAASKAHHPAAARPNARWAAVEHRAHEAHELPREYRIAHVFRTLGRGLVAEYDPA